HAGLFRAGLGVRANCSSCARAGAGGVLPCPALSPVNSFFPPACACFYDPILSPEMLPAVKIRHFLPPQAFTALATGALFTGLLAAQEPVSQTGSRDSARAQFPSAPNQDAEASALRQVVLDETKKEEPNLLDLRPIHKSGHTVCWAVLTARLAEPAAKPF